MQASLLQSFPGQGMPTSGLFSRNLKKAFPLAIRGEGCWIVDESGRRFLDAAGQAAVVSIGHGVAEIVLALAPVNFRNGGRVYFTSGGSEATETAIKLVRQYHVETSHPERYRVVSRRQSYHGSTLGAMSVSGNVARRAPYAPLIAEWGHIAPCFCYHCPFGK